MPDANTSPAPTASPTFVERVRARIAAQHAVPPVEIRILRFLVGFILILAAVSTLRTVLLTDRPIMEANKLEVGMMIGWIIAKSGTVIDWLFGGSESGTRRADLHAQQAGASPAGTALDPTHVVEERKDP
jgi:hypothetical protein